MELSTRMVPGISLMARLLEELTLTLVKLNQPKPIPLLKLNRKLRVQPPQLMSLMELFMPTVKDTSQMVRKLMELTLDFHKPQV